MILNEWNIHLAALRAFNRFSYPHFCHNYIHYTHFRPILIHGKKTQKRTVNKTPQTTRIKIDLLENVRPLQITLVDGGLSLHTANTSETNEYIAIHFDANANYKLQITYLVQV